MCIKQYYCHVHQILLHWLGYGNTSIAVSYQAVSMYQHLWVIVACLVVRKETHLQTAKQKMESANLSKFTVVKCEDLTSMYKQCILASSVYWQRCLDPMNPLEMSTNQRG